MGSSEWAIAVDWDVKNKTKQIKYAVDVINN